MVVATIKTNQDGSVKIDWPDLKEVHSKDIWDVVLHDSDFAHGESQKVFDVRLPPLA
jgi:hypothetical protein